MKIWAFEKAHIVNKDTYGPTVLLSSCGFVFIEVILALHSSSISYEVFIELFYIFVKNIWLRAEIMQII